VTRYCLIDAALKEPDSRLQEVLDSQGRLVIHGRDQIGECFSECPFRIDTPSGLRRLCARIELEPDGGIRTDTGGKLLASGRRGRDSFLVRAGGQLQQEVRADVCGELSFCSSPCEIRKSTSQRHVVARAVFREHEPLAPSRWDDCDYNEQCCDTPHRANYASSFTASDL